MDYESFQTAQPIKELDELGIESTRCPFSVNCERLDMCGVIVVVNEEEGMFWVQWIYRMDCIRLEGVSHGKVMSIVKISKVGSGFNTCAYSSSTGKHVELNTYQSWVPSRMSEL